MTDGELVRLCRQIQRHNLAIFDLIQQVEESDHPNAAALAEDLWAQCWAPAWADHVVGHYLLKPERWELGDYGIRSKREATK